MIELLKNMKTVTKVVICFCITAIIMTLILTSQLDIVLELFK